MRAGVYTADISPAVGASLPMSSKGSERKVEGIHDPLQAKALVLDNGTCKVAVLTIDQTGLRKDVVADIRRRVTRLTDIPEERILVASTHTHSSADIKRPFDEPEHPVTTMLKEKAAGAVYLADRSACEVTVKIGYGSEPDAAYNRRKRIPGGICTMTGTEGDFRSYIKRFYQRLEIPLSSVANVPDDPRPLDGPVDREVIVLTFESKQGKPVATLVNFACHPTILSFKDKHISADWVGAATGIMERELGCPCLFTQGASGNVRPYYRASTYSEVVRVGRLIGGSWLRSYARSQTVELGPTPRLRVASRSLDLPLRQYADHRLKLQRLLEETNEKWERVKEETDDLVARRRVMEEIHTLQLWIPLIESFVSPDERDRRLFSEEVQVLRFGPIGLIGLPGEFFAEFGLRLKETRPFPFTVPVTLANQGHNYHPTRAGYEEGGYEVTASLLETGASERLIETALELCDALSDEV